MTNGISILLDNKYQLKNNVGTIGTFKYQY